MPAPSTRTHDRDRGALDQHLAEQAPSTGAERAAHRVFVLPLQPARRRRPATFAQAMRNTSSDRPEQRHQQAAAGAVQNVEDGRNASGDPDQVWIPCACAAHSRPPSRRARAPR